MKNILDYLNKLLKDGDVIVLATSGGPDSMCLANLVCELKKVKNLKVIIAHVNHKLRVESEEEKDFVYNYTKENNLIWEYMEIKEYNHDNLENEARQKRYAFFEELVHKYQANYLMTAHHGDDLMETILMRLVRGSSIKGYAGFKELVKMNDYQIIRPLIRVTKDDIVKYMNNNHLKYFIDKSNYSLDYTRNRYRQIVLPFLKKENPNSHLKFLKFSQELDEVNNFLDKYILNIINNIKDNKGININKLLELDNFLIKKVIEYELSLIYINDLFLVSDNNTLEIIKLIKAKKDNGVINLPNNYLAIKEYNYFKIEHNTNNDSYEYILNDYVLVPIGIIKKINNSEEKSNYVIRLNSKDIKLPLKVRTKNSNDKMIIKNLGGSKKVSDIFIDSKIPKRNRDNYPIVVDSDNNILWIPGIKKSKFDVEKSGIYDIILLYEEE